MWARDVICRFGLKAVHGLTPATPNSCPFTLQKGGLCYPLRGSKPVLTSFRFAPLDDTHCGSVQCCALTCIRATLMFPGFPVDFVVTTQPVCCYSALQICEDPAPTCLLSSMTALPTLSSENLSHHHPYSSRVRRSTWPEFPLSSRATPQRRRSQHIAPPPAHGLPPTTLFVMIRAPSGASNRDSFSSVAMVAYRCSCLVAGTEATQRVSYWCVVMSPWLGIRTCLGGAREQGVVSWFGGESETELGRFLVCSEC